MSSDVEIHLRAYDEASSVIEQVGNSLSSTFQEVEGKTQELADTTSTATQTMANSFGQVEESAASVGTATEEATSSFSDTAIAMNGVALSGATLFMAFNNIENAQVRVDRANLMVERSTASLETALDNYNNAVAKYGENSQQAQDALGKLQIAQDAYSVSVERADMANRSLVTTEVYAALTVIPSLISIISAVQNAEITWTGIQEGLNAAMDANPILVVIGVIAALVAAFVVAYEKCKPFKDAVNAVGDALGKYLKPIIDAIVGALQWLWNNVLVPIAVFLVGQFGDAIKAVGAAIGWLGNVLTPVINAFKWFFDTVGGAISGLVKQNAEMQSSAEMMFAAIEESAKTHTDPLVTYFKMQYDVMTKTVDDSLNQQLTDINTKYDQMTKDANTTYQTDLSNFTAYWNTKLGVQTNELTTVDQQITSFYDKQIKTTQDSYQQQIDVANAGYQQQLTDFTSFWDQKFGIQNTQLDAVNSKITSHYDAEVKTTQDAYQKQIDATNQYYDDLQAATDAGLAKIRADRQADLDNLELNMLLQKTALETQHNEGLMSDKDYQTALTALNSTYNTQRSEMSDSYRLQELEAEKTQKDQSTQIATDRQTALTTIQTNEATAITGIENQKNTDLAAAQDQYTVLTTTKANALAATVQSLKEQEMRAVYQLEIQKNADLSAAQDQYQTMYTNHQNQLLQISSQKASEIQAAEVAAAAQKALALGNVENQINSNVALTENQKLSIIQGVNGQISASTSSTWSSMSSTVGYYANVITGSVAGAMAGVVSSVSNAMSTAQSLVNSAMSGVAAGVAAGLGSANQSIQTFNAGICFAHALEKAANQSAATMDVWQKMIQDNLAKGMDNIKSFNSMLAVQGVIQSKSGANVGSGGTQYITVYPTINIGNIGSPQDAANAVDLINQGISESFRRRNY